MIGKVLGDRYEIIEKIGGGGMALVYKAKCHLLNRYVAVKILRSEFTNDEEFINKFKRESQSAASLSHHNIVNIYDVGSEDNIYYIVMEYIKGKTLKELIREKGKLSAYETIDIAIQISEALNHAHKNHIVHRDIKPHNIMVTEDGRIKVTDFGIARAATSSTVTNTSNVIGSVHYFSPEQARGGYTDAKSDIYSLGIVMYEMITGRVPFQGDSPISVALKHIREDIIPPSQIDNTIPKSIEKIISKAVEKDQSLRYNSADEILKDLCKAKNSNEDNIAGYKDLSNSPTLVIPAVKDDDVSMSKNSNISRKKKEKNKNKNNSSNKATTIIAVILALIVTCGIIGGYFMLKDYLTVEEVTVPSIEGLSVEIAKEKIENLGLEFVIEGQRYDDEIKKEHIISQSQNSGSAVTVGSQISVIVSKGIELVEVPNLINQYSNEAQVLISRAKLKEGKITYKFSDYTMGIVIDQNPTAYDKTKKDSYVDYVISNGPEMKYLIMPNIIGMNVESAKRELVSMGFVIGNIDSEVSNDVPKDIVIWQSYPSGTEIEENTTIDIKISSGKEIINLDDNKDIDNDTNGDTNNDMTDNVNNNENENKDEDQEVFKQLTIRLPKDREEVDVKICKVQDNIKEVIYNNHHNTSENSIKVTVSGQGNIKFIIYFDGELKDETVIEF